MAGEASDDSIGELFTRLAHDAKDAAQAEVALVRARATSLLTRYKGAAIFFGAAGVLSLAALVALLVGLIMTLTPTTGPGIATLIVVGVVLLLAGILAMVGRSKLRAEPVA
ncbi:phage holin family protein [Sphingomonas sp.]|uniref:phage holin family protein n=1 Tax=Sphingomonas sp. TaxID=28214 RepID=UPI0035C83573